MYEDIVDLTFISSELCNLNCAYCELAKNAITTYHESENEKIKEAFISGEYLNRYKKVFYLYQLNPDKIKRINLWGQEPTLTLNEFTTQLPNILKWVKNSEELFFSTNGVAYIDRIINLIQVLNKTIDRKFKFVIQFSIDSLLSHEEQRGINPNIVINNIKQLLTKLNEITFTSYLSMDIVFHGVITYNLIHNIIKNNQVKDFWFGIENVVKEFQAINQNPKVYLPDGWGTAIQHPYNTSQQEGRELAQFVQESVDLYTKDCLSSLNPYRLLSIQRHSVERLNDKALNFSEMISDMFNYEYDKLSTCTLMHSDLGCGVGNHDIKMRYDGTLVYCQSLVFGLNEKELSLHDNDGITYDIQKQQLKNNFSPNLLTDPIEDIERFINTFDAANNNGVIFVIIQIVNLINILLKNKQIDESYQDNPKKILRHALLLSRMTQCWYDHISLSGSLYSRDFGLIRAYCNGYLDIFERYIDQGDDDRLWK